MLPARGFVIGAGDPSEAPARRCRRPLQYAPPMGLPEVISVPPPRSGMDLSAGDEIAVRATST
jgi:hypothetical protein